MEQEIMELITFGGEARSKALLALKKLKDNDFEAAKKLLEESSKVILQGHRAQTKLLQLEANGETKSTQLLMVHAQDHLMDAMVIRDLVEQIIEIQKNNFLLIQKCKNEI